MAPGSLDKQTRNPCSPPSSKFPKTIGVGAGGTAASSGGSTSTVGSATTSAVSYSGAVGLLANAGAQEIASAAPPGGPEANGRFVGIGYQLVLSNGQPRQLCGISDELSDFL
jgi:hypothetical protein